MTFHDWLAQYAPESPAAVTAAMPTVQAAVARLAKR